MKQEQHNNQTSDPLSDQLFEQLGQISKAHAYDILVEQVKELKEENERLKGLAPAQEHTTNSMRTQGEWRVQEYPETNLLTIYSQKHGAICQIPADSKHVEEHKANAAYICEAVNNYERLKQEASKLPSTIQELKEVKELCIELSDTLKECMKTIWSEHADGWKDVFLRHFKGHPYDKAEALIEKANKQLQ
jgi:phosphoribosylaminoimidazole-succinocarboxamide synthase